MTDVITPSGNSACNRSRLLRVTSATLCNLRRRTNVVEAQRVVLLAVAVACLTEATAGAQDINSGQLRVTRAAKGKIDLDSGQRINYGLRAHVSRATGGYLSGFIGQSYRFQEVDAFSPGSGLDDQESNIVGRVRFSPHEWFGATYRFQLDKDDFSALRSITGVSLGPQALRLSFSHAFFDQSTQTQEPFDIEQITTALTGHLSERWRFQVRETRSIGEDDGQLLFGASLIYEDECILAGVDFTRRFVGSRDNPPDSTIVLRVILRNLGELRSNVY